MKKDMKEAIELLKKVLAEQEVDAQIDDWSVGYREGIEHCINTLEADKLRADPKCSTCGGSLVSGKCLNLNCTSFV